MSGGPRILLVEFLNRDRYSQYRSERFPFVRGYAVAQGFPIRWICFGFDPETLPNGPFRMALPPDEAGALAEAIATFRPTHVLSNEELDAPLDARVRADLPAGALFAVYGVGGGPTFDWTAQIPAWLGSGPPFLRDEAGDEGLLLDEVTPDYACELVGPLARAVKPLTFVLGGAHCLYAQPLSRNPRFDGVDLGTAERAVGCSFCGEGRDRRYPFRTPPVSLAVAQIRAAIATLPAERTDGSFALWGAAAVAKLHKVFEAILAEGLPPLALFVACRIDELRRRAPHVEALLPRLAAAGHRLHVHNMGVENFAPAENERFNKGISLADVEVLHEAVTRWEATWPETFHFREHGGYGFILFTPWTTTEDVRANLGPIRRFDVQPRLVLSSRIQLMPGRPISRLAAHDGLEADREAARDLGGFDSGCITEAGDYEIPWRFRHPEVAALYGVVRRLWPAPDVPADEPLFRRVQALLQRLPRALGEPYAFAEGLLDAAEAEPRPATPETLLDRFEAGLPALVAALPPDDAAAYAEDAAARARRLRLERWAREALRLLAAHPRGLLRGFVPEGVTSHPAVPPSAASWGELAVTLDRAGEALRLTVLPRGRLPRPRWQTERFAVTHADDTPVDTPEKRRVVEVVVRGLERYVAAREGPGAPPPAPPAGPEVERR